MQLSLWASHPIKLDHNAIFIDQLPSNVSLYWQVCPNETLRLKGSAQQCPPLTEQLLENWPKDSVINLRLNFVLDAPLGELFPGLVIEEIQGADELYLNGELIAKTGEFPPRYENASFYSRYYFLPPEKLRYHQTNTLVLKIYNSDHHKNLVHLSTQFQPLHKITQLALSKDLFFSFIAALLFMIAIYKLYYFFRIPGSYETLSLSSFCLLSAFFMFLNHHFIVDSGFDTNSLIRWKSVSFIFAQMALTYFLFHSFELKSAFTKRILISFFILFGIVVLIWPKIEHLQEYYYFSKVLAFVPPTVLVFLKLVHKRDPLTKTQWVLMFALAFYILFMIADLSRYQWLGWLDYRENTALIIALLIFSVTAAIVLTESYWQYFKGATYDHLTGTLLKPSFLKRLSEEMQRCRRSDFCLLVAVIDIDQFKSINQNYGHETGDKALVLISATLTRVLRQFDLICRLNDDEFSVAATLPSNENTQVFLQRLHDEINSATVTLESGEKLVIKATTGAVIYDMKRHEAPEMLLHDAEHSVTEAKMKERGSIQWFDTDNPPLQFIF